MRDRGSRFILRCLVCTVALLGLVRVTASGQVDTALRLADWHHLVHLSAPQSVAGSDRIVYQQERPDLVADAWTTEIWESASGEPPRRLVADGSAPRPSPDGRWLAFLRSGNVWLMPYAGGEPWQLTRGREPASELVWSPDSTRLVLVVRDPRAPAPPVVPADAPAVDVAREAQQAEVSGDQPTVGEWVPAVPQPPAAPATAVTGSEDDPESGRPEPARLERDRAAPDPGRPLPRVIRRLQFKADGDGYLSERRNHLWVIDVHDGADGPQRPRRLTAGRADDAAPTWSSDGRWVAFVSGREPEPDATDNTELWAVRANGGEPVQLTDSAGQEAAPSWSAHGDWIAYRYLPADPPIYAVAQLRMLAVAGLAEVAPGTQPPLAEPVALSPDLGRPVLGRPAWSADGAALYVTIEDRGTQPLVRVATGLDATSREGRRRRRRAPALPRGAVAAVIAGPRVVEGFTVTAGGAAALISSAAEPVELYRFPLVAAAGAEVPLTSSTAHLQPSVRPPAAALRAATAVNQPWRRAMELAEPEPLRFSSDEGVTVEGWLLRPPNAGDARRLPLIVLLHGGPVAQFSWEFSWQRQWLAAQGYAVMYVNPRGSSGYGEQHARALWADWGGPDLRDVLAGVDHLAARQLIDPGRVGVGGWSYGGILTNYLITRSDRFAAAVSGASETDAFSAYGTDDLQRWWESELGLPYDPAARDRYDRLSAIRQVDAITTPTLFMGGELDWRVPISQSEQMYTQLRRRMVDGGPETGLIIYPGESHGITRPSFVLDRWMRMKAWYDRHVLDDDGADPFFGEWAWQ